MNNLHSVLIVAVVALVTIGLRFLPFAIFSGSKPVPPFVSYLGRVLPYAIMGMLVVYCLRNVSITASPTACRSSSAARWWPSCTCGSATPSSASWAAQPATCCWCSWSFN